MSRLLGSALTGPKAVLAPYLTAARDTSLVAVAVMAVSATAAVDWVRRGVSDGVVSITLTALAAAVALVAAVLLLLLAELTSDERAAWRGGAFLTYSLVAVPATSLGGSIDAGRASFGAVRLTAHAVVAVMLLLSVLPGAWSRSARLSILLATGLGAPALAGLLALLAPGLARAVTEADPVRLTVMGVWLVAAAIVAFQGLTYDPPAPFRAGLGILVLALAHIYRVLSEPAQPSGLPNLTFCSVRLLGLLIALSAAYELARKAVNDVHDARWAQQEELDIVADGLARRAERNHELRNGIAGIAGATTVLRDSATGAMRHELSVVAGELHELDALLDHDPEEAEGPGPEPGSGAGTPATFESPYQPKPK